MRGYARVLVAGGGPAGSMTAILLAREGVDVTLVEKTEFPRFHIGESLTTGVMPLLEFVGALDRIERHGFIKKYGGFFRMKQGEPPGHLDFTKLSTYKHSYQVVRSEFDQLLFEHARESGADAYQRVAVTDVDLRDGQPVGARLEHTDGSSERIEFDYLVDATGLAGLLSARYFKNRRPEEAFANVAVGAYFRGAAVYRDADGREHPGAFSMEALQDGSGWTWAIPLHDGHLSVGVVLHRGAYRARHRELGSNEAILADALSMSPDVSLLLRDASRDGNVLVWRDYSYFADVYAGRGYRLAGDAAGFIDPLFATGVQMAFLGALCAAATICAEIRGELEASTLERFHHEMLAQAYTRLIVTVAGFYQQLHNQQRIVLPRITPRNFQLAFDLMQPVISGNLDLNAREVSRAALGDAMKYMADMMLEGLDVETRDRVAKFLATRSLADGLGLMDDERVAGRFAALDGLYVRLKHGELGVARLGPLDSAVVGARRRVIKTMFGAQR